MTRILALDLGTSGCKAGLFEDDRLVASASAPLTTAHAGPGLAEQDPETWWEAISSVVRGALADAGPAAPEAIGVTGQSDSLVALDANARPVRPCMLWMDRRGGERLAEVVARFGEDRLRQITGLQAGPNFTAPKAAWLATHEPHSYEQARWLVQPKDAAVAFLTGEVVTDPSSASRTLLFDVERGAWSGSLVAAFGLDAARLPPVRPAGSLAGLLSPVAAERLELAAGIPVAVGGADRAAEALGLGLGGSDTMVSTGTATGVVRALPPGGTIDDPLIIAPAHVIHGERLAVLSQPTAGTVLDWLLRLVATSPGAADDVMREASESPPGANGVVVVPHFMGARSVRWDPSATGSAIGLTLATTRGDLARAVVEGVSFEVKACLAHLATALGPTSRLLLTGGGNRTPIWSSILVNVAGVPGVRFADRDGALVGAMLLARAAIGQVSDLRHAARTRLLEVDEVGVSGADHATYRVLADRYEQVVAETSLQRPLV